MDELFDIVEASVQQDEFGPLYDWLEERGYIDLDLLKFGGNVARVLFDPSFDFVIDHRLAGSGRSNHCGTAARFAAIQFDRLSPFSEP